MVSLYAGTLYDLYRGGNGDVGIIDKNCTSFCYKTVQNPFQTGWGGGPYYSKCFDATGTVPANGILVSTDGVNLDPVIAGQQLTFGDLSASLRINSFSFLQLEFSLNINPK